MTDSRNIFEAERYPIDIAATARFILSVQKENGEIPWSMGGKTDVWDHIESAMGLTVAGFRNAARQAYLWAASVQNDDGSFWSEYRHGRPIKKAFKDANMSAYITVGVLHYYLSTGQVAFLRKMWPVVARAIDFVCGLQGTGGEIYWARRADGSVDRRALMTGSSSIYLSLKCALEMAALLGHVRPQWETACQRLHAAINTKPLRFDQTKARFSMDWYYPVLCGAITGEAAHKRIARYWKEFTMPGWGVRCVADRPWATMAETAELALALAAMGDIKTARQVHRWLYGKQYADGAYWTGVTFFDRVIYTDEKTAWTGAAVLLATDAIFGLSSGRRIFCHKNWQTSGAAGVADEGVMRLRKTG